MIVAVAHALGYLVRVAMNRRTTRRDSAPPATDPPSDAAPGPVTEKPTDNPTSKPVKPIKPVKAAKPGQDTALLPGEGALMKLLSARTVLTRPRVRRAIRRWSIRLLVAAIVLAVLWVLFLVAVGMITNQLWFDSVQHGSVNVTMIEARILLFCVFAAVAGLAGGLTIVAVRRLQDPLQFTRQDAVARWTFRRHEGRLRRIILLLAVVVPAVLVGQRAAGGWQTYLLWRHATPWHVSDPQFHKDISFYVEVYPFHRMVVALLSQTLTYCLWIAAIGGYWYGGWRLRKGRRKVTQGFIRLASALFAVYLLLKAANYWLSRYALTTSGRGPVTGPSYTDIHAALPSKYVLVAVALVGAAALIANAFLAGRVRVIAGAFVLLLVASLAFGYAWPALLQHFREAPSAATLDLGEIANNQKATRAAYGLEGNVTTIPYNASKSVHGDALVQAGRAGRADVGHRSEPVLADVQRRAAVAGVLRVQVDPRHQPLRPRRALAGCRDRGARTAEQRHSQAELGQQPPRVHPRLRRRRRADHRGGPAAESPVFLNGGMPPAQQIPINRPQIYFGQAFGSSSYAIVGQPSGSKRQLEFDHPGGNDSTVSTYTTYQGHGGIPIGSALRRFLFAVQLSDPNIFFSSELNSASQLLTVRSPRARVAKVAPWLTLDGDTYPAVVDGQVKWIVDGYTTTANYPDSQSINLHNATSTTLTARGASVAQPSTQINYLHNSVKAVVDAYTGQVTLYEWDQNQHPDPLLKTWESVFPGLVKPQSDIPSSLDAPAALPHGPVQRAAVPAGEVPRDPAGELLQRERLLGGAQRSHCRRGQVDQLLVVGGRLVATAAVEVHVDVGRRVRRPALLAVESDGDAERAPTRLVRVRQLRAGAGLRQVHGARPARPAPVASRRCRYRTTSSPTPRSPKH